MSNEPRSKTGAGSTASNMAFTYETLPARILFGSGRVSALADEVKRLGCVRPLVLSTPFQADEVEKLAASLGGKAFTRAAMHTPVEMTEEAMTACRDAGADCVVALGGGSTVGLGKALSIRTGLPHIVVATTYAGSEVTPILGETENGVKTTRRDPAILPGTVIYDPDLTLGLPVAMSVTSGLNAMAHAVEALYAEDRNPVASMMALDGFRALHTALPAIVADPGDLQARSDALYGAWMCGSVLGQVGMALHHKLAHTLGGSFNLPHAETHSVLLPHTAAYNAEAVPELLAPLAELLKTESVGGGLHDFAASLGAPLTLAELGLTANDLDRAADLAVAKPYPNPRSIERPAIRDLLQRAYEGARPQ